MKSEPTAGNREIEPGLVLGRAGTFLEQHRSVDLLDVDAAVLDWFDCVGDLNQFACGGFRIGEWAVGAELRGTSVGGRSVRRISTSAQ